MPHEKINLLELHSEYKLRAIQIRLPVAVFGPLRSDEQTRQAWVVMIVGLKPNLRLYREVVVMFGTEIPPVRILRRKEMYCICGTCCYKLGLSIDQQPVRGSAEAAAY